MSTPFSKVILYKVPALSPTYRDTYNFANTTARDVFFLTKSPKLLSPSQVTRITNNQIKVPYPTDVVREYNYMSIQNQRRDDTTSTGPGDRIYYCFITNAEYISDLCTLITFEVDVIQTFYLEAEFGNSFVERTHTDTDVLFDNREPEPFGVQDYTVDQQIIHTIFTYIVIGIAAGTTISIDGGSTTHVCESNEYLGNRVYSGSEFWIFDMTVSADVLKLENIIDYLVNDGKIEAITDFFVVPTCAYAGTTGARIVLTSMGGSNNFAESAIVPTSSTPVSGYTPVNKKLHNAPFTMLRVISPNGQKMELKFEEFIAHLPTFKERGSWLGGGTAMLQATNYNTTTTYGHFDYMLSLNEFPKCSYASDSYAQWNAQKAGAEVASTATNVLGNLISTALLALASGYTGGATSGAMVANAATTLSAIHMGSQFVKDMGGMVADGIEASKKPNVVYNTSIGSGLIISQNFLGWIFERISLSEPEAKQIDDYFTMFGYAYNKIMNVKNHIINSARPKFCYIKTKGMSVQGNFPSEYKMTINDIFDNGITFWKSSATVGDYSNNAV